MAATLAAGAARVRSGLKTRTVGGFGSKRSSGSKPEDLAAEAEDAAAKAWLAAAKAKQFAAQAAKADVA